MRKGGSCCNSSACRSGRTKGDVVGRGLQAAPKRPRLKPGPDRETTYGDDSEDRERTQETQVQDSAAQSLPPVRTSARVHAEVRAVPPVLPQAGAGRRRHRGDKEQLVNLVIWSSG